MKTQYGIQELMRRVARGSIICRRAEDDGKEWEFRRVIKEEYETEEVKDGASNSKGDNMDVNAWKRLLQKHDQAQPALQDLVKTLPKDEQKN